MREKFNRKKGHVNIGEIGKNKIDSMTPEEKRIYLENIKSYLMQTSAAEDVQVVDYTPLNIDIKGNTK